MVSRAGGRRKQNFDEKNLSRGTVRVTGFVLHQVFRSAPNMDILRSVKRLILCDCVWQEARIQVTVSAGGVKARQGHQRRCPRTGCAKPYMEETYSGRAPVDVFVSIRQGLGVFRTYTLTRLPPRSADS